MKRIVSKLVIIAMIALMLPLQSTVAAVPGNFIYEGRLLDSTGNPIISSHTFRFSLWSSNDKIGTDIAAGTLNVGAATYGGWQEVQTITPNNNGTFSIKLGSITALPSIVDFAIHKFLQVEIKVTGGADTTYQLMDPTGDDGVDGTDRKTIGSLPYANNADVASASYEENFIIDRDNTVEGNATGAIQITFGSTLGKVLEYDYDNSYFNFNDDVNISGDLTVNGITATGLVNMSGTTGTRIREDSDPASNSACATVGELIYDTTDLKLQHCTATGAAGAATWADVDSAGGGGHTQNTDTGTNSNAFTLDTDDTGGNVDMIFGTAVGEYLRHDGSIFQFSDDVLMDGTSSVQFNDSATVINSSVDGQLDIDADVEVEITAPTVDLNGDLDVSGTVNGITNIAGTDDTQTLTNKTIDGDDNTIQDIDISSLKDRNKTLLIFPEYDGMTISEDGTDNNATIHQGYDTTNDHQYFVLSSKKSTLQDLDIYIAVKIPDDFVSFQATPIQIYLRTLTTNIADNQVDISMTDTTNSAVTLVGATDLISAVADIWIQKGVTFGGAPTFTAGDFIVIRLNSQAKSNNKVSIAEIQLNYIGK